MGNNADEVKESYTTEEVVDIIGDKLSFKMFLVVLSLMAFNAVSGIPYILSHQLKLIKMRSTFANLNDSTTR